LLAVHVAQDLARAVAAASAACANTELGSQMLQRADAVLGALAHSPFGNGVAKTDIQRRILYVLRSIIITNIIPAQVVSAYSHANI
jgi:hypothetical protein